MDVNQTNLDEKGRDIISQTASVPAGASTTDPQTNMADVSKDAASVSSSSSKPRVALNAREGLPPDTSLAAIFRFHMGIENDGSLVPPHLAQKRAIDPIDTGISKGRRAVNLGIYNRAIREELDCARRFKIWGVIINSALGGQIIFAAILTALGAGSGPPDAVAAFGTVNTIIAGFLTYLKGTGLPMRLKYFHNQWLKLRAYIEQRERDFASDDLARTHRIGYNELMEEIEIIEKMYHNIRKDIERHTPDNFGGTKTDGAESHAPGEGAPESSLAQKGLNALRNRFSGTTATETTTDPTPAQPPKGIESHVKNAVEDVEKRLAAHFNSRLSQIEGHLSPGTSAHNPKDLERGADTALDDLDAEDPEMHDVSDVALDRMRQNLHRAQQAQDQAEARIRELEARLARSSS